MVSTPNNLLSFNGCPYAFVATEGEVDPSGSQLEIAPRVCRVRTRDNIVGIYAIADPIESNMLASNVSVNSLIEKLSEVSLADDLYRERIETVMQNISFEIENRLLQLTFDQAEKKVAGTSSVDRPEKVLPALDEARSGAFLCAAAVTQSSIFLSFVGTFSLVEVKKVLRISFRNDSVFHRFQERQKFDRRRTTNAILPEHLVAHVR